MTLREDQFSINCLKKLVEDLTTSGKDTLNEAQMKSLKKLCKQSDKNILVLHEILMKNLKKKHAEIRLSSFQICNEFFLRSHFYRKLVLTHFNEITELTIGINPENPLPKPLVCAKKLKEFTIESIQKWYDKFHMKYMTLKLGYKYLKECNHIDFEARAILTVHDRRVLEEQQRKKEELQRKKIMKIQYELEENKNDIKNTIIQFQNCFKLLIPDIPNFISPEESIQLEKNEEQLLSAQSNSSSLEYGSEWMREHGINKETVIQIDLSDIHKVNLTEDNQVIIDTLRDQMINIKKSMLPKIKAWEQSILPYSSSEVNLIKEIIELKKPIESALKVYNSIQINNLLHSKVSKMPLQSMSSMSMNFDSNSDDSDFIDVPLESPSYSSGILTEFNFSDIENNKNDDNKEIYSNLTEAGPSGISSSIGSRKLSLKNKCSYLDIEEEVSKFDVDRETVTPVIASMSGLSQNWAANASLHEHEEGVVKKCELMGYATRAVNYETKWEPISWECRHPLPSGRLCPRKDREKCPLHGPVVPRDELGIPIKAEDLMKDQERQDQMERKYPAWQDPSLLADIKATTGVDLSMKNVKKRRKKYPNLTDIKSIENNPRKRLAKKIFKKI